MHRKQKVKQVVSNTGKPIADYDKKFYSYNKRKKEKIDEYQNLIEDLDDKIRIIDDCLNYFERRVQYFHDYEVIKHYRGVAYSYLGDAKCKLECIKSEKNESLKLHLSTYDIIFDINSCYEFYDHARRIIRLARQYDKDIENDIQLRRYTTLRKTTVWKKTN